MVSLVDMPSEMILAISLKVLPSPMDKGERLNFQIIRSVCAQWRAIAFSSTILWTSISFSSQIGDRYYTNLTAFHVKFITGWFTRSGSSLPLQLRITDPRGTQVGLAEEDLLLNLVRKYHSRWNALELHIHGCPALTMKLIIALPSAGRSNLHTLLLCTITFTGWGSETVKKAMQRLEEMTSIRHLLLFENSPNHIHQGRLGHPGLQELSFILNSRNALDSTRAHYLSSYSQLTSLTLSIRWYCPISLSPQDQLNLPTLRSLSLATSTFAMLPHMITPTLTELTIDLYLSERTPQPEWGSFSDFLSRASKTLRSITLKGSSMIPLLTTLSATPGITSLVLDQWPLTRRQPFVQFIPREWCPSLEQLSISTGLSPGSAPSKTSDEVELDRLQSLSQFLRYRDNLRMHPLSELTVHDLARLPYFPSASFELVKLGKLCVKLPW